MSSYLIRKLQQFMGLAPEERRVLEQLPAPTARLLKPGEDIIREGEKPGPVRFLLSGWAIRYKALEDGRRQILAFLIPGDMTDAGLIIVSAMDHSLAALTAVRLVELPGEELLDLMQQCPALARAFWRMSLVDAAIARERMTALGRRNAIERIAHLFCELFVRQQGIGLANGNSCPMPATQQQLACATGMSTVCVNRSLQAMRDAGLIILESKRLTIPDLAALQSVAMFNRSYLHLDQAVPDESGGSDVRSHFVSARAHGLGFPARGIAKRGVRAIARPGDARDQR